MTRARFVLLLLIASCGGTNAGDKVAPEKLTYADAVGQKCREPGATPSPLVVDLEPADRVSLEVALREGVAAVAYDCKGLRLLTDCHAKGDYAFKGATLKEQVVKLETADEIHANLPSLGGALSARLSADLQRGATLDVALAMVGKMRASRWAVGRADLEGDCDGVTHFVRGATVGAFAMTQGTRGDVQAAAQLFASASARSSAKKSISQKDGDRAACAGAKPQATAAPDSCSALLRVELRSLAEGAASVEPAQVVEVETCPQGMVRDGGKCRAARPNEGRECTGHDEEDCRVQCEAGNAWSCTRAGSSLMERGKLAEAAPYFDRGCKADILNACHNLGYAHYEGQGVPQDFARAMQLFRRVCDGGDPVGCSGVALLFAEGKGVTANLETAVSYYEMACKGGDQMYGCPFLGRFYQDGIGGVTKSIDKAKDLFQQACAAGSQHGCLLLRRLQP